MNILLLEDELDLSAVACEQMEGRGHRVFPAYDIAQAKAFLEDETVEIDILMADQMVPDGNGSLFAIEAKESRPDLKVVVVSGQLSSDDIALLDAREVEHFSKPVTYSDIVEQVISKHF
jgi:DNA-binding response OmpR family regulator